MDIGAWLDDTRIDPPSKDAPAEEWEAWEAAQAERRAGA